MNAPIFRPTRLRQGFALSLALVVAFLGIAVFSALHKHQGAKNRCSLNGFDHLMNGEAEAGQILHLDAASEWREVHTPAEAARLAGTVALFLRGPPSAA